MSRVIQQKRDLIEIRRALVLEYQSTGYMSNREIASKLNVSPGTVDGDVKYLNKGAYNDIKNHFKSLPLEVKKCWIGIELTIKAFTEIINNPATIDERRDSALRDRLQAYRFKLELLDGKAKLEEVFKFIDQKEQQKIGRGYTPQKGKVVSDVLPEHE